MRVGSPPTPGRGGSQRQLRLLPGGQDTVSQLPAASSLLPGATGMERPGRQAVCPAPGPQLTQPAPDWAAPSAAGTRAIGPPVPQRSGPVASPPGDRLVTKDGRLQAFAHPRLLPPPSTTLSFSRALWIWAKGQVLASLRPSQGQSEASAASSHVDGTAGEATSIPAAFRGLCCLPPSPSHTHQALHRELLLTHRKGLSLRSRPELLRVLEKRQGPGPKPTPLQEALHRRQQKQQKQQEEIKNEGQDEQLEFVRVRERLRHRPPPQPPSP